MFIKNNVESKQITLLKLKFLVCLYNNSKGIEKMKNCKLIVATHKAYQMPKDEIYLPVHVGAEGKDDLGFQQDNVGENISKKNPYFCELTGLYWAWKNLDCEYLGLVHYRRHFKGQLPFTVNNKTKMVLSGNNVENLLKDCDIILPKKRNYIIETLYSHYEHTMYVEPLDITGEIIKEKYPEYCAEFDKLKKRRTAHMFNMFVMKKEILNKYCTWLFDILFELEKRVDASQYSSFHARFYGRVSELLLDVWIRTNNLKYKEVKVVDIENINWFKKGLSFIKAKFTKEKYDKSF